MTDSLSVQPQIQKKDNTVPYGVAGAAIGGVGGAVAANYGYGIKTKPDLDKVFAMDPDTFKRNIEKAGENKGAWETAQECANKIQEAEKDYDAKIAEIKEKAKSAVDNLPADNDAKKALDEAQKNYDDKLADLVKNEKAKLEAGNKKIKSFVLPENTNLDKKAKKEYSKLRKEYLEQLKIVRESANYEALSKEIADAKNALTNSYSSIATNYVGSGAKLDEFYAITDAKTGAKTTLYNDTRKNIIEPLLDAQGHYKDKKSKAYATRAHEVTTQYINEAKKYAEQYEKITKYDTNFEKKYKSSYASAKATNLKDITSQTAEQYDKARKALTAGKMKKKHVNALMAKYGCKSETELKNVLNNRYGIAKQYESGIANIKTKMNSIYTENTFYKDFLKQRNRLVENNKNIKEAKKAIVDKFPDLFKQGATLSADEIAAQAKTKAEEAIAKLDVASKLQEAKDKAKAAAEKLGLTAKELTDEEAINKFGKTKEEFVKAIKDEAKDTVGKNLEKMKIANKTWTGLAAAAALGLAGMGIAMMNKKDA